MILRLLLILVIAASQQAFSGTSPKADSEVKKQITDRSLLRVNSTNQAYDFSQPWIKKPPFNRRGLGTLVEGGRLLVTAELVANSNYIELEKAATAEKSSATVERVDYDCNLALIRPDNPDFLKGMSPLPLDKSVRVGDEVTVLQLEPNGEIAQTIGKATSIAVAGYPMQNFGLLLCKLRVPLQQRDGSFTLPAVREGCLAGVLMRYDARSQTADLATLPVIRRFLSKPTEAAPSGFPRLGLSYSSLRDPQLRRYIGLKESGGVYVTEAIPYSSAAKAGITTGDVLLSVAGQSIDQDGNFEHPEFGRILFSHLTTTVPPGTDVLFKVFREGKTLEIPVKMDVLDPSRVVSELQIVDRAPKYLILGGLVFMELSRSYLQEWGGDWMKKAPQRLVYYDAFQNELPEDRGKIIILSKVLPSPDTLGYEELQNLVVTKVNGQVVKSLSDLAKAAKFPVKGFQRIEFEEDPKCIYLDAQALETNREALIQKYSLPELQRF